jgi:hypothetical protein
MDDRSDPSIALVDPAIGRDVIVALAFLLRALMGPSGLLLLQMLYST